MALGPVGMDEVGAGMNGGAFVLGGSPTGRDFLGPLTAGESSSSEVELSESELARDGSISGSWGP